MPSSRARPARATRLSVVFCDSVIQSRLAATEAESPRSWSRPTSELKTGPCAPRSVECRRSGGIDTHGSVHRFDEGSRDPLLSAKLSPEKLCLDLNGIRPRRRRRTRHDAAGSSDAPLTTLHVCGVLSKLEAHVMKGSSHPDDAVDLAGETADLGLVAAVSSIPA
jgi:hypothetical protein